LGVFICASRM